MSIEFAQPHWLWIGAIACVAISALLIRAEHLRRAALRRFAAAGPTTSLSRGRRWLRNGLVVTGVAMIALALARPLHGYRLEQTPRRGVDVVFAVDTSRSMRATDLRPDRLTRAKIAVADLAKRFDGNRLGLVAFAGNAFVQAPLTADSRVFLEALDALDTDVIPRGGSDLASAIRASEQALSSEPGHQKVMVLISDGEDLEGNAIAAARDAADRGLAIYTLGVGSPGGQLLEIVGADGTRELVRDEGGQPVTSRLDEPTLRAIAAATGGSYRLLGTDGRGLAALYDQARAKLPESTTMGTPRRVYTERFQIPLAIALACLLLELAIGDRRRQRRTKVPALAAIALAMLAMPSLAAAAPSSEATASPLAPSRGPVQSYNDGTRLYRDGDFASAEKRFEEALHTDDPAVQLDAYYDLGNARYRLGQKTRDEDRAATIAIWKRALEAYDAALAIDPHDADATYNRDFVAKQLAELEKSEQERAKSSPNDKQQGNQGNQGAQDQSGQNQGNQGNQGAQNQGAQNQGAQNQGTQNQGAQNQGAQNQGAQNQGAQNQGAQNQGAQNQGAQNQGA
ncbi:MAG: VWA domain-containing protein, partial [Kofleriaceae bacterium]